MHVDFRMNPYLLGAMVLLLLWLAIGMRLYIYRCYDDIREFWWGSLACALLGFTEPLFIPDYWNPPSVLSFQRWDLESFLFCFAIGGIAAVLPEIPGARTLFFRLDYAAWRTARRTSRSFTSLVHGRSSEEAPEVSEVRLS
jgi:hypothetical protein